MANAVYVTLHSYREYSSENENTLYERVEVNDTSGDEF
jgi:hypothetical protein